MPCSQKKKKKQKKPENRSNVVTNSIRALKMVHLKKRKELESMYHGTLLKENCQVCLTFSIPLDTYQKWATSGQLKAIISF